MTQIIVRSFLWRKLETTNVLQLPIRWTNKPLALESGWCAPKEARIKRANSSWHCRKIKYWKLGWNVSLYLCSQLHLIPDLVTAAIHISSNLMWASLPFRSFLFHYLFISSICVGVSVRTCVCVLCSWRCEFSPQASPRWCLGSTSGHQVVSAVSLFTE